MRELQPDDEPPPHYVSVCTPPAYSPIQPFKLQPLALYEHYFHHLRDER